MSSRSGDLSTVGANFGETVPVAKMSPTVGADDRLGAQTGAFTG